MRNRRRVDGTPGTSEPVAAGAGSEDPAGDHIRLSEVVATLRRRAWLVLGVAAAIVATGAVVVFQEPLRYQATAAIRLVDARRSITDGIENPEPNSALNLKPLLSQSELLKSRPLVGTVVDSEGLRLRPRGGDFSPSIIRDVRIEPGVTTDTFALDFGATAVTVHDGTHITPVPYGAPYRAAGVTFVVSSNPGPGIKRGVAVLSPRANTIDWVRANLRVSPRDETDIIDVGFTDVAPVVAQRVVNRLVTLFQDANVRAAQGKSRRRRTFLEQQLQEIDAQLRRAEHELASFQSQQQAFSSRDKLQAQAAALITLDVRRGELDADRRMYALLLSKLQTPTAQRSDAELRALIAAPDLSSNPVITQLYQRLAEYQATRDSLTTGEWRSSENNPDVARLDQLIRGSQQRLMEAVGGHVATLDARLDALGTLREQSAAAMAALPRAESKEEQLVRQADANRGLSVRLREELQKARMAEEVEVGQVEIVDPASLPYQPLARMRAFKLLLSLLIGLVVGIGSALLLDSSSTRIRRRVDLEKKLNVPVLSIIPKIATSSKRPSGHLLGAVFGRNAAVAGDNGNGAANQRRPLSPAGSEAFRLLRSSLKWAQGSGEAKTLVVSSALPKEGKTTASCNLAAAAALEGQRVLLIDGDFHRPRLHRAFRVARDPGLAQVLRGYLSPAAAARRTFIQGLMFLPAGRDAAAGSADLLGSDRMRALLRDLSALFDLVILDTPPMLAVADAAAVSPLADGVLLVVRAGHTNIRAVNQALQQFDRVGANVVGAVLNDAHGELQRYEEYYYSEDYADVAD